MSNERQNLEDNSPANSAAMNGVPTTVPALHATGVTVDYGPVRAVQDLNLELSRGLICGVVGMNGAGKSTFFKSIMGMVQHSGQILINGHDSLTARRSGFVGYVPQSEEIDNDFPISVTDVVMSGRYGFMGMFRHPKAADWQAVHAALQQVALDGFAQRPIGALSGGQRKRVFVARAIAQGAELMILDEPFAGVDVTSQDLITDILRQLAQKGKTLLVSTHDLSSLPRLCDQVALLNRKIVFHGSVTEAMDPERLRLAFQETLD